MEFIRDIDALSRQWWEEQKRAQGIEPEPVHAEEAQVAAGGVVQAIRRAWRKVTQQGG